MAAPAKVLTRAFGIEIDVEIFIAIGVFFAAGLLFSLLLAISGINLSAVLLELSKLATEHRTLVGR